MKYLYNELVEEAKGGCKIAMEDLIKKFKPLIYSAIGRYKKGWDTEDLYQDACIILLEAVRDFDKGRGVPFPAFIKSRIYYGIHNLTRKNTDDLSLNQPLWEEDGQSMLDLLEDPGESIEDFIAREEIYKNLRYALESLTLKQREIIAAHYFEGKKFKEIALARGVHYKTVIQLKDRAIKELHGRLGN